jgi:hypothetical protein
MKASLIVCSLALKKHQASVTIPIDFTSRVCNGLSAGLGHFLDAKHHRVTRSETIDNQLLEQAFRFLHDVSNRPHRKREVRE